LTHGARTTYNVERDPSATVVHLQERRVRRRAERLGLVLNKKRGGWYELWGYIGWSLGEELEAPPGVVSGTAREYVSQNLAAVERWLAHCERARP
jgi:hypothetical protein